MPLHKKGAAVNVNTDHTEVLDARWEGAVLHGGRRENFPMSRRSLRKLHAMIEEEDGVTGVACRKKTSKESNPTNCRRC